MSTPEMTVDRAVELARECVHRSAPLGKDWMEVRGGYQHAAAILVLIAQVEALQALAAAAEGTP